MTDGGGSYDAAGHTPNSIKHRNRIAQVNLPLGPISNRDLGYGSEPTVITD